MSKHPNIKVPQIGLLLWHPPSRILYLYIQIFQISDWPAVFRTCSKYLIAGQTLPVQLSPTCLNKGSLLQISFSIGSSEESDDFEKLICEKSNFPVLLLLKLTCPNKRSPLWIFFSVSLPDKRDITEKKPTMCEGHLPFLLLLKHFLIPLTSGPMIGELENERNSWSKSLRSLRSWN